MESKERRESKETSGIFGYHITPTIATIPTIPTSPMAKAPSIFSFRESLWVPPPPPPSLPLPVAKTKTSKYELEQGEISQDIEHEKPSSSYAYGYGARRSRAELSHTHVPRTVYQRPIRSGHLAMNPREFAYLKKKVNDELVRCCGTTLQSLQKRIDKCKLQSPRSCRDIDYDGRLSDDEKISAFKRGIDEFTDCAKYRDTMERAFALESDFSDPMQLASFEGHKWQRLKLERDAEECRVLHRSHIREPDRYTPNLGDYLKKIYA
jgi:hypothetical protein